MATIEEMITQLQHEVTILQDRDRDHDHHITLLLGQLLKIVPELTDIKATLAEHTERFDRIDARFDALNEHLNDQTSQLALILQKLDERK